MATLQEALSGDLHGSVEFANALLYVKGNSALTMTAISKRVDNDRPGLVSWLLSPLKPNPPTNAPKHLDAMLAWRIAKAVAGEGQLTNDPLPIFHFLIGLEGDPFSVLSPHLRLVGRSGDGAESPTDSSNDTTYFTHRALEQGFRDLAMTG